MDCSPRLLALLLQSLQFCLDIGQRGIAMFIEERGPVDLELLGNSPAAIAMELAPLVAVFAEPFSDASERQQPLDVTRHLLWLAAVPASEQRAQSLGLAISNSIAYPIR